MDTRGYSASYSIKPYIKGKTLWSVNELTPQQKKWFFETTRQMRQRGFRHARELKGSDVIIDEEGVLGEPGRPILVDLEYMRGFTSGRKLSEICEDYGAIHEMFSGVGNAKDQRTERIKMRTMNTLSVLTGTVKHLVCSMAGLSAMGTGLTFSGFGFFNLKTYYSDSLFASQIDGTQAWVNLVGGLPLFLVGVGVLVYGLRGLDD